LPCLTCCAADDEAIVLKSFARKSIDAMLVKPARRSPMVRRLVEYVARRVTEDREGSPSRTSAQYERLRDAFVRLGKNSQYDVTTRVRIVERFEKIDAALNTFEGGTTATSDGLFMAEALLSLREDGAVVECGCFMGGSTAKLSIVSKLVGRKLVVFDSFEGLPAVDEYDLIDLHARRPVAFMTPWTAGRYAAGLDEVRSNVERHGEIAVCTFVKGWFQMTLSSENVPSRIAFAFTDVDIPSSARHCLVGLWPRMADGGIYFSHDVAFIKVLETLTDEQIWRDVFREPIPIIFGAGWGLGDASPSLGFFVKGRPTAEYIKGLTLEK
jgi:O-methyltransferase